MRLTCVVCGEESREESDTEESDSGDPLEISLPTGWSDAAASRLDFLPTCGEVCELIERIERGSCGVLS